MSAFIESVRRNMRLRDYILATEKTYLLWIRRFIRFCNSEHLESVDPKKIKERLTLLATKYNVSVSTQKIVLNALVVDSQKNIWLSSKYNYSNSTSLPDTHAILGG